MDDLKPCPFCGGKADMVTHNFWGMSPTYGVKCGLCGSEGPQFFRRQEEAALYWNQRTEDKSNA